ncbi:MAG: TPM domain-containing protein [Clostridiales bacterium]|nr:TPM domain-containing protein [Clostridiales bacterium]
MKKGLLIALLLCCIALPALGESRVYDAAGLFTNAQEERLEERIDAIRETYQMDVAIVTNLSLDGKEVKLYAADFFETMGYGYGPEKDGVIFLISMGERDYCTVTHGSAIRIFTDRGIDRIHEHIQPFLSDGQYYTAMNLFLEDTEEALIQGGTAGESIMEAMPIVLIVSAAITLMVMAMLKNQMKTVRRKAAAGDYVEAGSFQLSRRQDIYLYTTTVRRKIESNSGRSGGGSSTFRSSSGGSFGGRSGKF